MHVTAGGPFLPVSDASAHTAGTHGAIIGGDVPARAPPPAAIFTAAKNKLLDGGGSGAWSPLSPGGTGASAQLAQLLGLFDEHSGGGVGGLGRSITESSDFILREVRNALAVSPLPTCGFGAACAADSGDGCRQSMSHASTSARHVIATAEGHVCAVGVVCLGREYLMFDISTRSC